MTPIEYSNRLCTNKARLKSFCDGVNMSKKQLMEWFNFKDYDTLNRKLRGVTHTGEGRSTRYHIDDIAEVITQDEATQCA